jgi:hypothetical protein
MDDDEPKMEKPRRSIADQFAELREICRQENYRLPRSRRTTRENAFVKVLDELAATTDKEIDASWFRRRMTRQLGKRKHS